MSKSIGETTLAELVSLSECGFEVITSMIVSIHELHAQSPDGAACAGHLLRCIKQGPAGLCYDPGDEPPMEIVNDFVPGGKKS